MSPTKNTHQPSQEYRFLHPQKDISKDLNLVYKQKKVIVGQTRLNFDNKKLGRPHTACIVGAALGDEGKGRVIDNMIGSFFAKDKVKRVAVIRFQGGSNSGHTVEVGDVHLALHQVPCGVMYEKALGIMDRGMTIHVSDLIEEIRIVERLVGSVKDRLILSPDAVLNTDLERAEEMLNRKRQGKANGGTGRGIGPSYAHHYDRLGFHINDLLSSNWKELLGRQYDRYAKEFALYDLSLSEILIPDFALTKKMKKEHKRPLGKKKEFLERLAQARNVLLRRHMVQNTYPVHKRIYEDTSYGVLFEGAQALGLHAWLGTLPDITASDTSVFGVQSGTAFWRATDIQDRIGVFKIPYTSSVGARHMPTEASDAWSIRVREEAHEYGTTTGRPRDILYPDLALLSYNVRMSGINALVGTHLDTAWEDMPIRVSTHYTDGKKRPVDYQPGLSYLAKVAPQYVSLPGWDGAQVRRATSFRTLPLAAQQFLAFLQLRIGVPITAVTTGPSRENYLTI